MYQIINRLSCEGSSGGKEFACKAGDLGLIPGLGRSPGEGNGSHTSILAWRILWTEEPGGLSPWGLKESDMTERLSTGHRMCNMKSEFYVNYGL